MTISRVITLRARPVGRVDPGHFAIESVEVGAPAPGQMLLRNLYLSIDPGVRNLLGAEQGYLPPIPVGAPMTGTVVGQVVESAAPGFAVGDMVVGRGMLGEYSLITPNGLCWKVDPSLCPSPEDALGVMGVPGLTAYFGLTAVGQPQAGQTVLVSSAAGGVGSLVAQMARRLGYRAVGIAGGPEKCRWLLDDLGLDAAIDYKGRDVRQLSAAIAEACPQGVDVFFDNVGGLVLDAALPCMNSGGRVVACGFISQYDGGPPPVMTNLFHIIAKGLLLRGFLLFAFADQYDRAFAALGRGSQAGQLRLRTQIVEGLDGAIPAFVSLFAGNNHGKPIVKI